MRALLLVALIALASCAPATVVAPSPTTTGSQPPVTATPTAAASTASSAAAPSPTRTPGGLARDDLSGRVRSLVPAGWRPWPVTMYVAGRLDDTTSSVVAVPADGALGSATELVRFSTARGWRAREDGAIVVALATSTGSARLAIWSPATATARWLTPDEPGLLHQSPVWSPDGTAVYYAVAPDTCTAPCFSMHEIRADGSGRRVIWGPSDRFGQPQFVTPDGKGLVWSRGQAGGSTDVLDIASGVDRAFSPGGSTTDLAGWREIRPRALVVTGTCCAGIPRGSVSLWDDVGGAESVIVGPRNTDPLGASNAIWDPEGTRVAVTAIDETAGGGFKSSIVLMDETGERRAPLAGTDDLNVRAWIRAGLIALRAPGPRYAATEVLLVSPATGAATTLYQLRDASLVQVLGK